MTKHIGGGKKMKKTRRPRRYKEKNRVKEERTRNRNQNKERTKQRRNNGIRIYRGVVHHYFWFKKEK